MKKLQLSNREIFVLILFIVSFVFLFITLFIHWKFITTDSLTYQLDKKQYSGCVCYKEGGYTCFQSEEGFRCKKNNAGDFIGEVILNGAG